MLLKRCTTHYDKHIETKYYFCNILYKLDIIQYEQPEGNENEEDDSQTLVQGFKIKLNDQQTDEKT